MAGQVAPTRLSTVGTVNTATTVGKQGAPVVSRGLGSRLVGEILLVRSWSALVMPGPGVGERRVPRCVHDDCSANGAARDSGRLRRVAIHIRANAPLATEGSNIIAPSVWRPAK